MQFGLLMTLRQVLLEGIPEDLNDLDLSQLLQYLGKGQKTAGRRAKRVPRTLVAIIFSTPLRRSRFVFPGFDALVNSLLKLRRPRNVPDCPHEADEGLQGDGELSIIVGSPGCKR